MHPTRRDFLHSAALAGLVPTLALSQQPQRRLRVAAIYTVFYHRSHAHVILEKFFYPYLFCGRRIHPGMDIVSIYADQRRAEGDLTDEVSRRFKIPVYRTINEALCVGGKELAVDAVLLIGEHGDYPVNAQGVREYPRKRFFDEIVATMRRSRRFVPLFNDKHLSYRWDWAREMYDTARQHGIPFLAGSSVPLAQRIPALELKPGSRIEEIVAIHGGPLEVYDFHGLEILQSLAEFRQGGETGVAGVEFLTGEALWNAARDRRWSRPLAEAALAAELGGKPTLPRRFDNEKPAEPHGVLIHYRNGPRALVLKLGSSATRWNIAWKLTGADRIQALRWHVGPFRNRMLFSALAHAIQHHFRTGQAPYPVERTLLTTGILAAAMQSRARKGQRIDTPHLNISYEARDFSAFRENGASWKILTEDTPEPQGPAALGVR